MSSECVYSSSCQRAGRTGECRRGEVHDMTSPTASYKAFWSYTRRDNEKDKGRIRQLAEDIADEYEILSGDELKLFLDLEEIKWGDDWKASIDSALEGIAFFIPVVTPAYFNSDQCRRELQRFADKASALGLRDLILPLIYVDVPELKSEQPDDPLIALIKTYNWVPWTEKRLLARDSSEYRQGVNKLAVRLIEAGASAQSVPVEPMRQDGASEDDALGTIDKMARLEATMPEWQETLEAMTEQINLIGEIAESSGPDIEKANESSRPMAARLTVLKKLATNFREPAAKILDLGAQFTAQLFEVDQGIRAVIEQAPREAEDDPSAKEQICEFFGSITELHESAEEGLSQLKELADVIQPIEAVSRDLRPPMRDMRKGLTMAYEGLGVMQDWTKQIAASPVLCHEGPATPRQDAATV